MRSSRPRLWLGAPVLLVLIMGFYLAEAQEQRTSVPRLSNDLPIRKAQLVQDLSQYKAVLQDLMATYDRALQHRYDASGNMFKAQLANLAGIYKKAGKVACQVGEAFGWGTVKGWAEVCNGLIEATEFVVSGLKCSEGNTEECEAFQLKTIKKTGKTGGWGDLGDSVELTELTRSWQKFKESPKDPNAKKDLLKNWCDQSAKWITKVTNQGGNAEAIKKFYEKQQAVCAAGEAVYEISEDLHALSKMAEEQRALDRKILAALSSMQRTLEKVRAKTSALEQQIAALPVTMSEQDPCDSGPVVNPELARSDEPTNKSCTAKRVKKDKVCDENLGCPDDESEEKGPGKDLLVKLNSDLERIQNSQAGTAGGALPGESLESESSVDKTAMLRSLRSGLGTYRQGRDALSSSGGSGGGVSGGNCSTRVPVPQELRAIAQRRGVSVPPDSTVDQIISQAGSAEAASSGLRRHIQELQQSLAQWPRGRQDDTRRQMELEVGYEQSLLQAVEVCRRGNSSAQRVAPPVLSNAPNFSDVMKQHDQNRPKPYKGNPYQCDGPGC